MPGRDGSLSDDDKPMLEPLAAEDAPPPIELVGDNGARYRFCRSCAQAGETTSTNNFTLFFSDQVSMIAPTSNIEERLFSYAKAVVGMHRQAMTPLHLESILFLKVNHTYWSAATVHKVVWGAQ
ncbi:hypothetical protein GN244_ATG05245 [Phytophthora infestans]|uniref:HAT C-terminal dimerisation domain-containing protein n=1 Tax=Phytophthora infestans TaxID=4787 RepID=A0A833TKX3_PHYIN|nr:hypothetical protein GN244_ATG05245 [Phytophthora infestans]